MSEYSVHRQHQKAGSFVTSSVDVSVKLFLNGWIRRFFFPSRCMWRASLCLSRPVLAVAVTIFQQAPVDVVLGFYLESLKGEISAG